MNDLNRITDTLVRALALLAWEKPVHIVYNPLDYAREPYHHYLHAYASSPKEILLWGMNPGPWGMVQTGIPFGSVPMVRDWLGITAEIGQPPRLHPKRPVLGFNCCRGEVSGDRLWGWARSHFPDPAGFFQQFFVANYCPLAFFDRDGRNLTPDKLSRHDREQLTTICDRALQQTVAYFKPTLVLAVGSYVHQRLMQTLIDFTGTIGVLPHPSPANPVANKGWAALADQALQNLGIRLN